MTTRRADLQPPDRSKPAAQEQAANTIETHALKPVRSGDGLTDPSPFSRPRSEDGDSRLQRIEQAAYRRAESRGFAPGHEMDDWLAAEREIDQGSPAE